MRAAQDRSLEDGPRLFWHLSAQPVAAQAALDLPGRPGRATGTARLSVRFAGPSLARP